MWQLIDQQPIPPAPGAYRCPHLFEGVSLVVVGVFSPQGKSRDWQQAGDLYQLIELPGQGYVRVSRVRLRLERRLTELSSIAPYYLEFSPKYWVEDWQLEIWAWF